MQTKFTQVAVQNARARVQRVTGLALPFDIQVLRGDGLRVALDHGCAQIVAEDENALARGFFRLARCVKEGKQALDVCERRHFASCGAMADASRGAVMRVDAVKRYIDQLACLGMNLLLLYTEDTYEVPEYPRMGYLRGRYSLNDLRELDEYAAQAGVELAPCIQTLGHMRQFLQWQDNAPLRDQMDILMIDDERTYALIEAQVRAMRQCVRSKRIHIGMDEAHGVGLGQYLLVNGQKDRFELLCRHLERVVEICAKYDFRPIMWSDMFFRLGSKENDYYDVHCDIPQRVIDLIPPVDLCYWDYYHMNEAFYDHMLTQHARMGEKTVFAGGIWTWSGFLPHVKRTEATMRPALRACARHGVDTVFATMWGDDGAETNLFLASSQLPIFSEACWQGSDCPETESMLAGEALTGLPHEALTAMGEFYPSAGDLRTGKGLVWCDLLYPLLDLTGDTLEAAITRSDAALSVLRKLDDAFALERAYACLLFEIVQEKARLVRDMRSKYVENDREWLRSTANDAIPLLIEWYERLMQAHRALWERDMKRFGWEVLCLRYGAAVGRLRDTADELCRYLAGKLERIEELEEAPLCAARIAQHYEHLVTPSAALGTGF